MPAGLIVGLARDLAKAVGGLGHLVERGIVLELGEAAVGQNGLREIAAGIVSVVGRPAQAVYGKGDVARRVELELLRIARGIDLAQKPSAQVQR